MVVVAGTAVLLEVEVVATLADASPWRAAAGDGEGDFFERFKGASGADAPAAAPPAMSTWSSSSRGEGEGAVTTDWGEPMGPVVVLAGAIAATGGEIEVECGDWK